jgi:hypothetical protein
MYLQILFAGAQKNSIGAKKNSIGAKKSGCPGVICVKGQSLPPGFHNTSVLPISFSARAN